MCVEQSAIAGSPLCIIYNMPNSLFGKTQMPLHAAAAFKQRKEFFRRRIRLMYREDSSSSSLIYSIPDFPVYANFCRIFLPAKKAPDGAFSNTETFFFCILSYTFQGICLGVNHFGWDFPFFIKQFFFIESARLKLPFLNVEIQTR